MTRRRFAFWIGLVLFNLAEQLRVSGFDKLAAALIRSIEDPKQSTPEHWSVESNRTWWWYERQNMVEGQWTLTGITTPVNKKTGQPLVGKSGYLEESVVPAELRVGREKSKTKALPETHQSHEPGIPDPARKARHGRPPSEWLRSLHADELSIWLKTIEIPEAGVSGMTFWEHLTEHHDFDPDFIEGLTIDELAKLHAAAHFGY